MFTENPLRDGLRVGRTLDPTSVVIFGATGDLTARKLVPALFSQAVEGELPPAFNIVGYARRDWSQERFRDWLYQSIKENSRYDPDADGRHVWENFAQHLYYVQGNFNEAEGYCRLDRFLRDLAEEWQMPDNRLYYLAAPPSWFDDIILNIDAANMAHQEGVWRRIVIEKPFGHDLDSAHALNDTVNSVFDEEQVYRIDHYLGKETVQNILVVRFANTIFEPIWNRRYVDHVQISVVEPSGAEDREEFYDEAGVIRDIVQNHLLQLLTLIAMEPPVAYEAGAIRDEKVKVLRAARPIEGAQVAAQTVRGQYTAGTINGERVPGYTELEGIPRDSDTATYAAIKWYVDNWRWQGVPFYLRSGKRLPTRVTEVSIHFKEPPHLLFGQGKDGHLHTNVLALRIQPDEGISLRFESKLPGQGLERRAVTMDFRYGTAFGVVNPPDAYERLLLDAIAGDATLFARRDEIEWAWRLVDPILAEWEGGEHAPPLETYEAGTWGPAGADALLKRDGRRWRRL
ncbi:MAG: glucose-6-phosphate dehydrogenase [Chloroflexi bacterium]|nr:glucose-6-phosphate dehydrogenase [Chloroflexota bacterium]